MRTAFAVLALALAWVPFVRDAAPTVALSVVAALGLAVLAAADGRTWPAVLLGGPASLVGLVAAWAVGGLLRSADAAFAAVVDDALPNLDTLPGRAGRRAATGPDGPATGRRVLLGVLGGLLVALVLVVVASALRRMALYEQRFGWTVLRIHVAAFEVWLAAVLVLCALAWLLRRTAWVPAGVVLAAGTALLALNLASPDALAASANVDRLARAGKVDTWYLERRSDDAVPALARLPEPERSRVLGDRSARSDPWYAVNLGRLRAAGILGDGGP